VRNQFKEFQTCDQHLKRSKALRCAPSLRRNSIYAHALDRVFSTVEFSQRRAFLYLPLKRRSGYSLTSHSPVTPFAQGGVSLYALASVGDALPPFLEYGSCPYPRVQRPEALDSLLFPNVAHLACP